VSVASHRVVSWMSGECGNPSQSHLWRRSSVLSRFMAALNKPRRRQQLLLLLLFLLLLLLKYFFFLFGCHKLFEVTKLASRHENTTAECPCPRRPLQMPRKNKRHNLISTVPQQKCRQIRLLSVSRHHYYV